MKTNELTGATLDWAVAKCEGRTWLDAKNFLAYWEEDGEMHYSTDWAQGGPIIERKKIGVWTSGGGLTWHGKSFVLGIVIDGPTPLIAAMRCYVASELGDNVEIPDALQ
jgi:hypothetical protein